MMTQTLFYVLPAAWGEESEAAESGNHSGAPPLELLEFLGEWENRDGEWIDPMEFEDWPLPDQEQRENEDSHS